MRAKYYIVGSVLFFAMMACVVPGLSQPAAPTLDVNNLPTVIALTASAAMAQTAAAAPPTPAPTLAELSTATPRVSLTGTSLLLRDDQTTVFTDRRAGVELIVPAGWLPIRINEKEYYDAWTLPELSDPAFQNSLTGINDLNPDEFRLFVLDVQEGHLQGSFVTNINLLWREHEDMSLDNDKDLQNTADSLSQSTRELDILNTDISVTSSGIPIGVIISKTSVTTLDNTEVVVFYKMVFINARAGVLMITLTTTQELRGTVFPAFDAIIATITLVNE
jgi:hypothetical protein